MADPIAYIDQAIADQESTIRWHIFWMVGLISLTLVFVSVALLVRPQTPALLAQLAGGIFTSVLAGMPFKEIPPRREAIRKYRFLRELPEDELLACIKEMAKK